MRLGGMRHWGPLEESRKGGLDYRVALRLLTYVRPYKLLILVSILAMLLYAATEVASPWLIKRAIDSVISKDSSGLAAASLILVVNGLIGYASNYANLVSLSRIGQHLLFGLRTATFNHLQLLSISYFDRTETGSNMSRVQNDVQQLQEFLSIFTLAVGDILRLVGFMVAMLLIDWQLALITLSVIPLLFLIMLVWQSYAWRSFMRVRRNMAAVNATLQENISGVRVVQSLNRQQGNLETFDTTNQRYLDESLRANRLSSALNPSVELITAIATALVIIYGGIKVLNDPTAVGVLVAFALYVQRFFEPIRSLTMHYGQLQRAMTSGQHIFEILDTEPLIKDAPRATELTATRGEISYENVSFSYSPDVPVLKNINLRVRSGEKVALVGPTGAGKTTLASLLSRLHDVIGGRITVDGMDIREVVRASLNRQVGVVPQEPYLFSGTVRDNIRYCHQDLTDEDIEAAARVVGAHEFISKLENGYDSQVEEMGLNFSPGQRQLISLARALAPGPRIVVLDEATATVDSHTEMLLQQALLEVLRDRTALIIAHRLSTVRTADRIVVMDHGSIVEEGTHRDLLKRDGLYAKLYALNREG